MIFDSPVGQGTAHGFLDQSITSDQLYHPKLIINDEDNTMVRAIKEELGRSDRFDFSVAFISASALGLLKQALVDFAGHATIITSTYLDFNEPNMFRELLTMDNVEVCIHPGTHGGFHAKGYVFTQDDSLSAIVGSSNFTLQALTTNKEWNLRFSALPEGDITYQLQDAINQQRSESFPLTEEWIEEYERARQPRVSPATIIALEEEEAPVGRIEPNSMQQEALEEIWKVRTSGEKRALVVSATGTGKTILAALAAREIDPGRMLFIVHREQILNKAMSEFKMVLDGDDEDFGRMVGAVQQPDRKYVFAMERTLSRSETLASISSDSFDLIIIDEVHRAGAAGYNRIIDHFGPSFLLGLTATPERTDDFNIFELFDYNVPYEIRLQAALEADMLAPFNYYGVTEYVTETGEKKDDPADLSKLVAPERVHYILEMLRKYGFPRDVKGLMFCSGKEEAHELSRLLNEQEFNGQLLRTVALTGESSAEERETAMRELELGSLDYILTRDIFNEGIDIPAVNQVVMLRNTQSSIIFTQQLGRGLRKARGKDHLRVIDFIGNYQNNFLIPIALFGDSSLNPDIIKEKMIKAQTTGVIAGVSSVSFDEVSRRRVLESLQTAKLDSMHNLKKAVRDLEYRLGRLPMLIDFARFHTVDPVVIASNKKSYWNFLVHTKMETAAPTAEEAAYVSLLDSELLNGKRPQEMLLIRSLLERGSLTKTEFVSLLDAYRCASDDATVTSVERILTLEFFVESELKKYGPNAVMRVVGENYLVDPVFSRLYSSGGQFAAHVDDAIETALYLARHDESWSGKLVVGHQYTRKDVCRLLNFESNQYSTLYGYKTDAYSGTCPIFITHDKAEDISATTQYEDGFDSEATINWFTKSNRSLDRSKGEIDIANNFYALHVFVKKSDVDGGDFFYLGEAKARDAHDTTMSSGASVVNMKLDLEHAVEPGLFGYLADTAE
ncbi:MAG: DEAD/DEAH box helicase [Corynebacterium variabile]|uniref:DEAD/DEAH box helicase n=1 Tax=Corynebacterium variabile TaxID=1727 RepID=UPI003F9DE769